MRDHVRFYLNGREHIVRGLAAFSTLAEFLRGDQSLCGTKIVCAEGDCGACTVLVGRVTGDRIKYVPMDCCILFVHQLDATHVITVEGLGNGELHPVQQAMVDCHGSQCGYCTPGIVMALAGWAEDGAKQDDMRVGLTGNLCRCTGYVPIMEAAEVIREAKPASIAKRYESAAQFLALQTWSSEPVNVDGDGRTWFAPTSLDDAVAFKAKHPDAAIVAGATELGVWRNKRGIEPKHLLCLSRIRELSEIQANADAVTFGANVTWTQIEKLMRDVLPEFYAIIRRFGSPQIRNAATLVGNVANGSPIADSLPLLMVMDAEVEMIGPAGKRVRSINGFYNGYKQMDLRADEIITRIVLPLPASDERLRLYKVSRRNDLDISTFGAAIRLVMDGDTIQSAAVAYAGVAPTVVRLAKTEDYLTGQEFSEATFRQAGRIARGEIVPLTDVRGSLNFRLQLCENVLRKFYLDEVGAEALV